MGLSESHATDGHGDEPLPEPMEDLARAPADTLLFVRVAQRRQQAVREFFDCGDMLL